MNLSVNFMYTIHLLYKVCTYIEYKHAVLCSTKTVPDTKINLYQPSHQHHNKRRMY